MSDVLTDVSSHPAEQATTDEYIPKAPKKQPAVFWPWLGGLLGVGLIIVLVVTYAASNWFNGLQHSSGPGPALPITTLTVQRSTVYTALHITLLTVQSAPAFSNDLIHTGPALIRVNLRVTNPTSAAQGIAYYDVARLLVPKQQPLAPTNFSLPASLPAGATQTGWLDFPAAKNIALNGLVLQLGNSALGETLATIPVSGPYTVGQYDDHLYTVNVNINYLYQGFEVPAYWLYYHLQSVETSYSYKGVEVSAGEQYYILNFAVDNPNRVQVQPGFGYDYIRLDFNGSHHTAEDNSLPYGFTPREQGLRGFVVFEGPANLHTLFVAFLFQARPGWTTYTVSL